MAQQGGERGEEREHAVQLRMQAPSLLQRQRLAGGALLRTRARQSRDLPGRHPHRSQWRRRSQVLLPTQVAGQPVSRSAARRCDRTRGSPGPHSLATLSRHN